MLLAARKASEGCGASFQLAGLLQKRMQARSARSPNLLSRLYCASRERRGVLIMSLSTKTRQLIPEARILEKPFLANYGSLWPHPSCVAREEPGQAWERAERESRKGEAAEP